MNLFQSVLENGVTLKVYVSQGKVDDPKVGELSNWMVFWVKKIMQVPTFS